MFGIGGLLGYMFVMIESTTTIRILASLFAFCAMIFVGIALGWSGNEKEYFDTESHEVFVVRDAFLFAADKTYYHRVNSLFGKKIARCEDGEDHSCTAEITENELILTECGTSTCTLRELPLE